MWDAWDIVVVLTPWGPCNLSPVTYSPASPVSVNSECAVFCKYVSLYVFFFFLLLHLFFLDHVWEPSMTFLSVQVVISPLVADSRESEPCDRVVIYLNVPYLSISRKTKGFLFLRHIAGFVIPLDVQIVKQRWKRNSEQHKQIFFVSFLKSPNIKFYPE